jgi:hypothetical protein
VNCLRVMVSPRYLLLKSLGRQRPTEAKDGLGCVAAVRQNVRESKGATTMLKRFGMIAICLSLSLLLATTARAQLVCSLGSGGDSYYNPNSDMNASPDALRIAHKVADALCGGTCGAALIRNPTAGNVLTFVLPNGAAKVVYNPQFLKSIETTIGIDGIFGIFAHEIGHVVDGRLNVAWMPNSWAPELRADAWAGCALARTALSEDQRTAALHAILRYPSPTHPARDLRIQALDLGYQSCGGTGNLPRQGTDW